MPGRIGHQAVGGSQGRPGISELLPDVEHPWSWS